MAVTASVGIASLDGAANAAEVLHDADLAMYESKSAGRKPGIDLRARNGRTASGAPTARSRLRDALEQKQFELYYQPVDISNVRSSAPKPCCAGTIRSADCSDPTNSSARPKRSE